MFLPFAICDESNLYIDVFRSFKTSPAHSHYVVVFIPDNESEVVHSIIYLFPSSSGSIRRATNAVGLEEIGVVSELFLDLHLN